ncbi:MAG: hypothetical protein ACTH1N_00915 [Agrococcus casei]|uniref:hypothetical protein n=1 Tax=Agrococcus casei TaxID=343512 RepID=UPI003F9176E1
MRNQNPTWNADSEVRRSYGAGGEEHAPETVVTVTDGLGQRWEVTVDQHRLTSVRVFADDVKTEHLREVPIVQLRAVALAKVREVEGLLDEGARLDDALAEVAGEPVALLPGGRITVAEFAEAWRDAGAPKLGPGGMALRPNRRKILAEKFHTSPWNIDKWTRVARDLGFLDEAREQPPETPGAPALDQQQNGEQND